MFRVLGAVEVGGNDSVRGKAQRVLTSALLLDRGSVVSADRLSELIWGDEQPANPRAALQSQISRLRRVLPATATLETSGRGYRLLVGSTPIDADLLETELRSAEMSVRPSVDQLDAALMLWRGEPYADLFDDGRARAEAARLEIIHQALCERRVELLIGLGRAHEAISELERQRRDAPLRERTVELLMRTYLSLGRKEEALEAYQRLRSNLVDELGLDPSPELRELETAILTETITATSITAASPAPSAPLPIESAPARRVDVPTSSFVGRHDDARRIESALETSSIVTLVGPGGVGKTRLSLHVAATRHDAAAVHVVELTALEDAAQFADLLVSELDLRTHTGMTSMDLVLDHLAARNLLLVLDNCEHVIAEAAQFALAATRRAPGLTVLATSQEPLNVDGEQVVRIDPLTTEEAVTLFFDRSAQYGARDRSANADQIVERIVVELDGLPLAVELAAARSASMSLDEIEASLDERFTLLSKGRRAAPDRHQSLRALVDWSVQSLDERLLDVFVRSSVFAASFTTGAVAAVAGMTDVEARDAVAELVDRSLLVEVRSVGRRTRYSYLQTMQAYARQLLARDPSAPMIVERHSDWVLARAEHARALLPDQPDDEARWELMSMLADVRVAHRRFIDDGDADRGLRLAAALHFLAFFRMHTEMLSWIVEAADRFAADDHALAEDVAGSASIATWVGGDLEGARHYAELAEQRAQSGGYPGAGRGANEAWGDVVEFGGDAETARHHFDRALELARASNDRARIVCNLVDGALTRGYAGDIQGVRAAHAEARQLLGDSPSRLIAAWVAYTEGEALADADPDRALAALTEALDLADDASLHFITGVAGLTRASLQVRHGDPTAALPGLIDLLTQWAREGAVLQLAITLRLVIALLVEHDDKRAAGILLGGALSISGAEPIGADAIRMSEARDAIAAERHDAEELIAHGAELTPAELASLAIGRLRAIAAP